MLRSTPTSIAATGLACRMHSLFSLPKRRTLIVPVDDSLIFGPFGGLANLRKTLSSILAGEPSAILAYPGAAKIVREMRPTANIILNLTGSTVSGKHTEKVQLFGLETAVRMNAVAVAAHINMTDDLENQMLSQLSGLVERASDWGIPVCAIIYPRKSKDGRDYNYEDELSNEVKAFAARVMHCCRTAYELGADIIKSTFVPDPELLRGVVDSACGVPVVFAGGALKPQQDARLMAEMCMAAGAAGVSFGRNVFNQASPEDAVRLLKLAITNHAEAER